MTSVVQTNRNLVDKKSDNFYCSFYGLPENERNILGRQVMSVERPVFTFNPIEVYNKGKKVNNNTRIDYQPITLLFYDDNSSLTNKTLYEQIKRQTSKHNDSKFDIEVNLYSVESSIVEIFKLKKCLITTISHSEQIITDSSEKNIITVSIAFDDVDYQFPELGIL